MLLSSSHTSHVAEKKVLNMAKKKSGKSLSQSIRDHLQANPSATPNQIVAALAKKGIKVSPGLASNIKYTSGLSAKKKTGKKKSATVRRGAPKKKAAAKRGAAALTVEDLLEAKKLVNDLGGIDEVRKALDALERLK